jgi:tetratricopeptide (TPR) repeat protein
LNEGLAEVYSTFEVEKGQPRWGNPIVSHVQYLNYGQEASIPIDKLLLTTNSNPLFNEEKRVGVFYAESWAFVHYLMFGKHRGTHSALDDFLKAYSSGASMDEAFRQAFGVGYETMDRQLKIYLRDGQYTLYTSPAPQTVKTPAAFAVASPEVVEIALARLGLGSGHLDLARKHAAEAVKCAPNSALVYDALACVEAQENEHEAQIGTLEKAIQLGSKDAWTFVQLAGARSRTALALGGIPPSEARKIADLLEQAIDLRPNLLTAYKALAFALLEVERVTKQDALIVGKGSKFFPDDGSLIFGFAQLAWKCGSKENARKLLAKALAHVEKMERAEADAARETELHWFFDETMAKVKSLMDAHKAREALKLLDNLLAKNLPVPVRSGLVGPRRTLEAYAKYEEAQEALKDGRTDQADQLCRELVQAPQAPSDVKHMAESLSRSISSAVHEPVVAHQPDP